MLSRILSYFRPYRRQVAWVTGRTAGGADRGGAAL